MNLKIGCVIALILLSAITLSAEATSYPFPKEKESLIGELQFNVTEANDSAIDIAKRYDLGYNALEKANPHLDMAKNLPHGIPVQIPTKHLLPDQPRKGIVINLPEMRMYYFSKKQKKVYTYPIGIGKIGKTIPITKTFITRKAMHPVWIPPEDIREFNLQQGIILPKIMPAGPDNPLGPYAIYMRLPTYLIHSTIFPGSVGKRASFGCIRMYESDIQGFFPTVSRGTPVYIVNVPTKVGWQDDHLYVEAHAPLAEHTADPASLPGMVHLIANAAKHEPVLVDWQLLSYIAEEQDGIPHEIGMKIPN